MTGTIARCWNCNKELSATVDGGNNGNNAAADSPPPDTDTNYTGQDTSIQIDGVKSNETMLMSSDWNKPIAIEATNNTEFATRHPSEVNGTTVFDSSFENRLSTPMRYQMINNSDSEFPTPSSPSPEPTQISSNEEPTIKINLGSPENTVQSATPSNPSQPSSPRTGGDMRSSNGSIDLARRIMPNADPMKGLPETTDLTDYGINRIIRPHAKGGMGLIQIAYDQFLKREVALKELRPDVASDPSIVQRFIGEAEITAQLEHPGIIPIHSLALDVRGNPYYTMKLIKGKTFQEAIREYHKNPTIKELKQLLRRFLSVCQTMAFAHDNGVIHRDLKPANIMLSEHGETIVMDWGLAKVFRFVAGGVTEMIASESESVRVDYDSTDLTVAGAVVGTPAFMSPEQASPGGTEVGPASDVYSLGAILYVLLTNKPMYSGRGTQEVLEKVRKQAPMRPSALLKSVPSGLEAICLKATARHIPERYQTAIELKRDLEHWLDGEPIDALPKSSIENLVHWLQKRTRFVVMGVLSLVFALLLTALFMAINNTNRDGVESMMVLSGASDIIEERTVSFHLSQSSDGTAKLKKDYDNKLEGGYSLSLRFNKNGVANIVFTNSNPDRMWNLNKFDSIKMSLIDNPNGKVGLVEVIVRIGDGSSYYEYRADEQSPWWPKRNWFVFDIPLEGNRGDYRRTISGHPDLSRIEWIEVRFVTNGAATINLDKLIFVEK
jgi:serine/threonine protein kinase